MKKSLRTITAFAMIFLLAAATIAACGGGKSGGSAANSYIAMTTAAAMDSYSYEYNGAIAPAADYAAETIAETAAWMPEEACEAESGEISYDSGLSAAAGEPAPAGGDANGTSDPDNAAAAKAARKLIRTVNLNVETTEFDDLLASISQFVDASGGYIEQSDLSGRSISGGSGRRYASITARVPANQVDAFLSQMSEKSNVTYRSENVQDVTLQYTDIESRKKSLTIEQERLWELLEKADSLDAVIALEERLSEIRYELERFESQLRTYDNQVDYSTVYISIDEVAVFTPTEPDSVMTRIQKGFARNLKNVGNGFVNFFVWFVSSIPTLLVWAVFIAIIVLIVRAVMKRRRKDPHTTGQMKLPGKKKKAGETPVQVQTPTEAQAAVPPQIPTEAMQQTKQDAPTVPAEAAQSQNDSPSDAPPQS